MAYLLYTFSIQLSYYLVLFFAICTAFNLDDDYGVIKRDTNPGNLFGFSVALHQHNVTDDQTGSDTADISTWVLVGAPKAANSFLKATAEAPGTVFKCNSLTTAENCDGEIPFDTRAASGIESKDNQWLGVSLQSGGLNKPVVTCAHRYLYKTSRANFHLYEGTCRSASRYLEKESQFYPCRQYNQDDLDTSKVPSQNSYGHCLTGIGLDIFEDSSLNQFLFGTPGAVSFTGRVMEMEEFNAGARPTESDLGPDSTAWGHVGYSITHGMFFKKKRTDVAAGGPRARSTGQVFMFERIGGATPSIVAKQALPNADDKVQIGSAFGFSLCSIDTDKDGFSELVVSAPFHEEMENAGQGLVYIYHNKNGAGQFILQLKLKVSGSRINFGTSLGCGSDLNLDGHPDLIVGAPYDDNGAGAIYIYQGSENGIIKEYTQRILASTVSSGLVAFGRSLGNGAVDVDSNGYPDIVVGAPGSVNASGAAVVLRTRPVIRIIPKMNFIPAVIDTSSKLCPVEGRNTTCFMIGVCLHYEEMSGLLTTKQKLSFKIVADPGRSPRVRFSMTDTSTFADEVEIGPTEECFTGRAYLVYGADNTIPVYPDLEFSLSYDLPKPEKLSPAAPGELVSLQSNPVLERNFDEDGKAVLKTKFQSTLLFKRPCDPCVPDLVITTPANQTVRLGSATYNLNVTLSNIGVDPAYAVGITMLLPSDVSLSRVEVGLKLPQCSDPVKVNGMMSITCQDLYNEFSNSKTEMFVVVLDTQSVEPLAKERKVILNITSANIELSSLANNIAEIYLDVIAKADISLQGTAVTKREVYGGSARGESAMVNDDDAGLPVRHNYYVVNDGPDLIPSAEVTIHWPYQAVSGKHLLYLAAITSDAAVCKVPDSKVNELKLKLKSSAFARSIDIDSELFINNKETERTRREVDVDNSTLVQPTSASNTTTPLTDAPETTDSPKTTDTPSQGNDKTPTTVNVEGKRLDCRENTAKCTKIVCSITNFEKSKGVTISIRSISWNTTFLQDYYGDVVTIFSYASVAVTSNASYIREIDLKNNNAEAFTTVTPAFVSERKASLSGYIIPLAVVAGVLLLALLIFVLYKIGFFNRNRSTYTTRSTKPDKEGADDSLLQKRRPQMNGDD